MLCRICNTTTELFGNGTILKKYKINYYKCPDCYFIQTQDPYWLQEAYQAPITQADTGLVQRNLLYARAVLSFIKMKNLNASVLDYGGGYGLFARLLQDHGVDCDWYDKYCQNIFAEGHQYKPGKKYGMVTSFEVIEHQVKPLDFLKDLLEIAPMVLFSTVVVPHPQSPLPEQWWYYELEAGQHISFFSRQSLFKAAQLLGVYHYSWKDLHLFTTDASFKPIFLMLAANRWTSGLMAPLY